MTFRTRFFLLSGTWIGLVAALTAVVPLLFRTRLPHPVAVHWGPSGAPDDAMPLWGAIAAPLGLWVLLSAVVVVAGWRGGVRQRLRRTWQGAVLGWGGLFVLGLTALTVWANLDAGTWSQARSVSWHVAPLLAVSLVAGWLGWSLARRGPDEVPASEETVPALRLRPGERAVWVSSETGRGLMVLALVLLAVAAASATAVVFGFVVAWPGLAVCGPTGLACLATSSVRAQVTESGLLLALGPWGWPIRRIPLERIVRGWSEVCRPTEVGGWGIRWIPGRWTIMLRGGECLVVVYPSGRELGISVDDSERGAALLNALIQQRPVR